jgi:nitrite reductase/ring-hydroxylating ferredoxin subunit
VTKHALFPSAEFGPGEVREATLDGIAVVVVRTAAGELRALRDICPHQGARLSKGRLEAAVDGPRVGVYELSADRVILRCPWHGYEFDVETGRCLADAGSRVRTYPVTVEDGVIVVERA